MAAQLRKQGSANCVLCGLFIREAEHNHASTCCRRCAISFPPPPSHPKPSTECMSSIDVSEFVSLHVLLEICMQDLPLMHA